MLATERGKTEVVKLLLKGGAASDMHDEVAVRRAMNNQC